MSRWFSWQATASSIGVAGLGLLVWLGISVAMLRDPNGGMVLLHHVQRLGLILGWVLCLAGFFASSRPARTDAVATRWHWASLATLASTLVVALVLILLLAAKPPTTGGLAIAAAVMALAATLAVLAAGMVAATGGRPEWRRQMVAPVFLGHALLAGATLLFALLAIKWPGEGLLATPAPSLIMLAVVMAALKALYWFENGGWRAPAPGHDGEEMLRARLAVVVLLAVVPVVLALLLFRWPQLAPRLGWCAITACILCGGALDRRLQAFEAGRD